MAKGFKSGGRNFHKGVTTNPKGCPGMPKDVREARKLTQNEFVKIACNLIKSTTAELFQVLADPATTALELMIGGIIMKAVTERDQNRAEFLLNRIIGRVTIQADVTLNEGDKSPTVNLNIGKKTKKPTVIDV
jgi:hypothetical protein